MCATPSPLRLCGSTVASRLGAESVDKRRRQAGTGHAEDVERWSAGTWSSVKIERQRLGAIAVAIQRGNTLIMLTGYSRAGSARANEPRRRVEIDAASEKRWEVEGLEVEAE